MDVRLWTMKNKELELSRLRGILSGIATDAVINEQELLFS